MPDLTGHHMRMRLEVDGVIARDDTERRRLARNVLSRSQGFKLLVFKGADTHLHFDLSEPDRRRSIEFCRRVSISWRRTFPDRGRLITLPPRPIEDLWHLHNAFNYILDQEKHHGCEIDRYHEASMLPDLLGLRVTGAHLVEMVRRELPRIQWDALMDRLGPVDISRPFSSLDRLAEAAAAAMALPDIAGMSCEQVAAKRAAVQVATPHLTAIEIADLLGVTGRRVAQIQAQNRNTPMEEALERAVELQLRFRSGMTDVLRDQKPEHRAWPIRKVDAAAST